MCACFFFVFFWRNYGQGILLCARQSSADGVQTNARTPALSQRYGRCCKCGQATRSSECERESSFLQIIITCALYYLVQSGVTFERNPSPPPPI